MVARGKHLLYKGAGRQHLDQVIKMNITNENRRISVTSSEHNTHAVFPAKMHNMNLMMKPQANPK